MKSKAGFDWYKSNISVIYVKAKHQLWHWMEPDEIPSLKDNFVSDLLQNALEANYSYLSKLHIVGEEKNVKAENRSDNINIRENTECKANAVTAIQGVILVLIKGKIHKNTVTLIYLTQWFSTRCYKTSSRSYQEFLRHFKTRMYATLIFREYLGNPFHHNPKSLLIGVYFVLQMLGHKWSELPLPPPPPPPPTKANWKQKSNKNKKTDTRSLAMWEDS